MSRDRRDDPSWDYWDEEAQERPRSRSRLPGPGKVSLSEKIRGNPYGNSQPKPNWATLDAVPPPSAKHLQVNRSAAGDTIAPGARDALTKASHSSGAALPDGLRSELEQSLDSDLSSVRVHTNPAAGDAADAISANAYTVGQNIFFASAKYDPDSATGKELIAHEVAHAVQSPGRAPQSYDGMTLSQPRDSHEQEVHLFAERFARAQPHEAPAARLTTNPSSTVVHRDPKTDQQCEEPSRPTGLWLAEVRRDGEGASGERFPNLAVVGDEIHVEVVLDAPLSLTQNLHNEKLESFGQLETIESGAVGDDGLRYYFRLRAIQAGSEPMFARVWDEDGQLLEATVWFEIVTPSELRRRVGLGTIGEESGQMRAPLNKPAPYDPRGSGDAPEPSRESVIKTSRYHRERYAASSAGRPEWEETGYAYANAELDRAEQDKKTGARVGHYVEAVENAEAGLNMPQPLPAFVGYTTYYQARHDDFLRRHPKLEAPDYYLDYGEKYALRFSNALFPHLSSAGKAWLIRARTLLQLAFEEFLLNKPAEYDSLERKPDEFREFAYGTHANAYLKAGLADLPIGDHYRIGTTPDFWDLFSGDGLAQVIDVFPDVVVGYLKKGAKPYKDIGQETKEALTDPGAWGLDPGAWGL